MSSELPIRSSGLAWFGSSLEPALALAMAMRRASERKAKKSLLLLHVKSFGFKFKPCAIISFVAVAPSAVDFKDITCDFIQEITVVCHSDHQTSAQNKNGNELVLLRTRRQTNTSDKKEGLKLTCIDARTARATPQRRHPSDWSVRLLPNTHTHKE